MRTPVVFLLLIFFLSACTASKELTHESVAVSEGLSAEIEDVVVEVTPDETRLLYADAYSDPSLAYKATPKRVNDLLHTKLDIRFDWEKQYVLGQATLQFKPYFYPTSTLTLDAKGFDVHEVALITPKGRQVLNYRYDQRHIEIDLDKTYSKDETYAIYIDYTAKPDELVENSTDVKHDNKGLFFINPKGEHPYKPTQIWTQGRNGIFFLLVSNHRPSQ